MDVIPALDILDGKAVRLLRGNYEQVTVYDPAPVSVGVEWMRAGASIVHVVDLEAARGGGFAALDVIRRLRDEGVRCQVGGGVRTPVNALALVDAGAERVVVGSAFVDEDGLGEGIVDAIGEDAVVAAIDVRDGRASGHGWSSGGPPFADVVFRALDSGVRRMLVTGIAVDGTMEGPDLELIEAVANLDESIRLIASGGVGTLGHIRSLARIPAEAVIIGRALYEDQFTLAEAVVASDASYR
jgi:phosphoribosylformimino-5-aminoimidazole carboxamide ribotide isomerase